MVEVHSFHMALSIGLGHSTHHIFPSPSPPPHPPHHRPRLTLSLFLPPSYSFPSPFQLGLIGPLFTIIVITSRSVSAAAMVVNSAFVSYAGATSTISAAMKLRPSSPRMMVRSSRVDQPPVSGVPVAGASVVNH